MMIVTVKRILTAIKQHVVHPTHIPFIIEAEPPVRNLFGYFRIRGGFFRHGYSAFESVVYGGVKLFNEFNRFKIAVVAVNVRRPFARIFVVIEVEHRSYRVYSQPVYTVLVEEKMCGRKQKTVYSAPSEIEFSRTPALMFHSVP